MKLPQHSKVTKIKLMFQQYHTVHIISVNLVEWKIVIGFALVYFVSCFEQ